MIYELGILESSIHNKGKVSISYCGFGAKKKTQMIMGYVTYLPITRAKLKSLPKDEFTINIIKCFSIQNTLYEQRINQIKLHGYSFSTQF